MRLYYVGWSSSTGEADWALRRCCTASRGRRSFFNTAYFKNDADTDIKNALLTTDKTAMKLYKDAQETIYKEAPWAPLVIEALVGPQPEAERRPHDADGSFNFTEIDPATHPS